MILNAIAAKLKCWSKDDFKGRPFEATLILQAVSWYLRYPLSYRDIEELFLEHGLEVDHSRGADQLSADLLEVARRAYNFSELERLLPAPSQGRFQRPALRGDADPPGRLLVPPLSPELP